jgi:hypothetical protein
MTPTQLTTTAIPAMQLLGLRNEFNAEIRRLENERKEDIRKLRNELQAEISRAITESIQWLLLILFQSMIVASLAFH